MIGVVGQVLSGPGFPVAIIGLPNLAIADEHDLSGYNTEGAGPCPWRAAWPRRSGSLFGCGATSPVVRVSGQDRPKMPVHQPKLPILDRRRALMQGIVLRL